MLSNMIRTFASHPTAANLLMLAFLVVGISSLPLLQKETFPDIDKFEVRVSVTYPGAGPTEVEQGICLPLENATDGISFIDEKRCEARSNIGFMTLKMLENGDFDVFLDDVRSAVDRIDNFPANSKLPIITETGRTAPVVTLALTVDDPQFSTNQLKDLAELIKAKMQQDPGIPLVELSGFSQRQLIVSLRPEKLRQYQVSLQQIATLLQKQNINLPLGDLTTPDKSWELRFVDERQSARTLANLTLLSGSNGAEIRLSELADIRDAFDKVEDYSVFDNQRAALLKVSKNSNDDSLTVLQAVKNLSEQLVLPQGVNFTLTQDFTTIVKDRLSMLLKNAWQGLILVFITLLMFFGLRYSCWVIMGLPVSFIGALFVMVQLGITINMLSMVALLLALGILMDDAIVIAESIAAHSKKGLKPLDAVTQGVQKVARGVFSSFLTTVFVFGSILGLQGDLGQVLRVIPLVLLIVISISLIEAFLILPSHLRHTLEHHQKHGINQQPGRVQLLVDGWFEIRRGKLGSFLEKAIYYRYAVVGFTMALFFASIALMAGGIIKFKAFPDMDGDVLEARLIMPAGTSLVKTEQQVEVILDALQHAIIPLQQNESSDLIRHSSVRFNENQDAFDSGAHLATISLDLLPAEQRNTNLDTLTSALLSNLPDMPEASRLVIAEPSLGPAGRAIELRLSGIDRQQLSQASYQLQNWLKQYQGVYNLLDDYRPGKPQLILHFKPQSRSLNIDANDVANQLRSAYAGIVIDEFYRPIHASLPSLGSTSDNIEIVVQLEQNDQSLDELRDFPIQLTTSAGRTTLVPLATLADIEWQRDVSRIQRINNQPTVTIFGSVNTQIANTQEILNDTFARFIPDLKQQYPGLDIAIEGEVSNAAQTQGSLKTGLIIGLFGVFALLSFQFRNYSEPMLVMLSIPMALIGVIWGHLIMGYDLSMPSMVGFVSLAGIVVNNAILLVEFVKHHVSAGMELHSAARQASQDRLRAILLTTSTTIAGMLPLLFETSLQAQVLIPLVISISFGLLVSTVLVLIVLPCLYTIFQDLKIGSTVIKNGSSIVNYEK